MSKETYSNPYLNAPKRCTVLEWLPVSDVLPEHGQLVMTIDGDAIIPATYHKIDGIGSHWQCWHASCELTRVTHWAFYPKPPKL